LKISRMMVDSTERESSFKELELPQQCSICLSEVENPINLCVDDHEATCRDCSSSYIESQISSSYFGTCPCITCPSLTHQKSKRKKILLFNRWSGVVHTETANRYKALASHLLAFLCGGCHTLKTLDGGFEPNLSADCYLRIESLLSEADKYSALRSMIASYSLGDIELEKFYEALNKTFFPQLSILSDAEAWNIFMNLLKTIEEPERRCNLHLRYLRDRPRMKTLCCNREHCFRCKIKDFHEGKSCLEYSANLDNSIVTCPSCGISLARGDGCNTISCVCGKQFSWTVEKENTERSFAFRDSHPDHTSEACAQILCTQATPSSSAAPLILQAKAWQIRNRIEVNRALRCWFKRTFSPCPSQMCARLVPERQPDGVREAMDLWRTEFSKDVAHCKAQNDVAIASLFTTLFPIASERPVAAHLLVALNSLSSTKSGFYDSRLVISASKWIESHREEYKIGVEHWELRSARQFLFLYGCQSLVGFKPAHQNTHCAQIFNRAISNSELAFTNNDMSVQRPGSASCYPAAFADLPSDRCMFRVRVDEAPRSSNWLTFGLARRGMANSSSDGVGRTGNSWGLSDDRSSSSSQLVVASCGVEVAQFRKIQVNDILTAIVDVHEGWLEVSLNETEAVHRFSIPAGISQEYVFAMTFANDHRVTIIADAPLTMMPIAASSHDNQASREPGVIYLNSDHTCMLANFKKQLKLIMSETDETNFVAAPNSELITDGTAWFHHCESSRSLARTRMELMMPALENLFHMRRNSTAKRADAAGGEEMLRNLPVSLILDAVSWYRHNLDQIIQDRKGEMAMNFSLIHGDSAPFIAAMTAAQSQQSSSSVTPEELQAATAYMHFFAEEMHEWYDLDMMSGDPLVENVAKTCRCLPRHLRTCPFIKKNGGS
jgi:hypothetical protein